MRRQYIVVREVATDELRICPIAHGYTPPADPAFTWGGPFKSRSAAENAVKAKDESLRKQLYPEAPANA